MEITIDILKAKFKEYNEQYFKNRLKTPQFKLLKSYKRLGLFEYRKIGVTVIADLRLGISKYFDWEEEDLKNVIIHEMIHQYLAPKMSKGEDEHGIRFQNKCKEFNKKYNLNITTEIDTTNFKKAKNAPKLGWFMMRLCLCSQSK